MLLTEGFGSLPISEPAFELLHANMGREAMVSAETQTRWGARRPEIVIPLRAEEAMPTDETLSQPLEVGARVRVLRAPHLGAIGEVLDLPTVAQVVESGARLPVAVVDLGNGQAVKVPLGNLELIR